jgi:hypothetical protein
VTVDVPRAGAFYLIEQSSKTVTPVEAAASSKLNENLSQGTAGAGASRIENQDTR